MLTETAADPQTTSAPAARARAPWWSIAGPGLAVGLVSAAWGLSARGLWLDEAYSLGATRQLGTTLSETSGTMGAYYVALTGWLTVSESVWWMRALSVVFAVGAVAVAARLFVRLVGDDDARLAALLTPLSFLWLSYAQEARSYAMVLLLTCGSWLALDHAIHDDDRRSSRWWALHTGLAVLGPLAHGLAVLQLLPQAALLLAGRADRGAWLRWARGTAGALAVTGALLSVGAGKVGDWVAPLSIDQLGGAAQLFTSPFPALAVLVGAVIVLGAVAQGRAALRATTPRDRARALVPLLWGLAPIALLIGLSVVRPSLVPRYALGSVPGLALLLVAGVRSIGSWRPSLRLPAAALLVALLVVGHIDAHRVDPDAWTLAAGTVATSVEDGDVLLFAGAEARPPFESAWRTASPRAPLAVVDGDRPLGHVLRFEPERTEAERRAAAADAGRVWVVGDTGYDDVDATVAALAATHRVVDDIPMADSAVRVVLLAPVGS